MRNYEELEVWQNAHAHVLKTYEITRLFPRDERMVLVPQMRRSAISGPANIVEGSDYPSDAQFARYLDIASGSFAELEYFWKLCFDLRYIDEQMHLARRRETQGVRRQLFALARYLRRGSSNRRQFAAEGS